MTKLPTKSISARPGDWSATTDASKINSEEAADKEHKLETGDWCASKADVQTPGTNTPADIAARQPYRAEARACKSVLQFSSETGAHVLPHFDLLTDIQQTWLFGYRGWWPSFSAAALDVYATMRFGYLNATIRPRLALHSIVTLYVPGLLLQYWRDVLVKDDGIDQKIKNSWTKMPVCLTAAWRLVR